ncbi:MAG: DUF481 domain-containing protein [Polyangiaceae bacterium]|nr:DUF481 domain-containing protein [Polyangiaceae bacterium]
MRRRSRSWCGPGLGLALVVGAAPALAEEPAAGLVTGSSATSGSTDVATSGFEAAAKEPEIEDKNATELKLSAGGLLARGNSRSLSLTGAGKLRLRREDNQLSAATAGNYGQSAATPDGRERATVENLQGKLRYDRFVAAGFAVFLATSALRDRFQGLDLRLNLDPGFAYYVIDAEKHQLWAELGYDLQYDVRRSEALVAAAAAGEPQAETETRHSVRGFLGYENSLNDAVVFATGAEALVAPADTSQWRLVWDTSLTSQLAGNFSLATSLTVRYDHAPLPEVKRTDVVSAVSLVYQLL